MAVELNIQYYTKLNYVFDFDSVQLSRPLRLHSVLRINSKLLHVWCFLT